MHDDVIARMVVQLKHMLDPVRTERQLSDLYHEQTGRLPTKKCNLLEWFFDNYTWDGICAWEPRDRLH